MLDSPAVVVYEAICLGRSWTDTGVSRPSLLSFPEKAMRRSIRRMITSMVTYAAKHDSHLPVPISALDV